MKDHSSNMVIIKPYKNRRSFFSGLIGSSLFRKLIVGQLDFQPPRFN